jgi:hypothetical protein
MKTSEEFNEKYGNFLEERHYGLAIDLPEVVDFLDNIFKDLVRIPGFKYSQIKMKFGSARFYADEISADMCFMIEEKIDKIVKAYRTEQKQRDENNKV